MYSVNLVKSYLSRKYTSVLQELLLICVLLFLFPHIPLCLSLSLSVFLSQHQITLEFEMGRRVAVPSL